LFTFGLASLALILPIICDTLFHLSHLKKSECVLSPDEVQGFDWLRTNAATNDLVVTTFDQNGKGSGGQVVRQLDWVFIGHLD